MRRTSLAIAITAATLLLLPATWGTGVTGAEQLRVIQRDVASPFPFAKVGLVDDSVVYRVDVDPGAVVVVDAEGTTRSPFYLRYHPWGAAETQSSIPSWRQSPTLSGADATSWRVEVDPAAGARIEVRVLFHGHLGDRDGRAWPFTLTDVTDGSPCVAGACLP